MTRRISSLAIGLTLSLASVSALAQEEAPPDVAGGGAAVSTDDAAGKIHLGVRAGYGIPLGESVKGRDLSEGISGKIPLWLDLGYMVTPNIMVGLYAQYAFVLLDDEGCPEGFDCSASVMRFGVQGIYNVSPGESLNPWFGLGVGYEIANSSVSGSLGGIEIDSGGSSSGLEFLNLQAGADYKVADNVGIGPFASFSLGQYSSCSLDSGGDCEIPDKALHQWLVIGVKGSFGF